MNTKVSLSTRTHRAYIVHPLRGKGPHDVSRIVANINDVDEICRNIVATEPEILPLSPIHAFGFLSPLGDQTVAFDVCRALLSICDELRVYGEWETSEGCRMEIEHARSLGLPVVFEDGHIEGGGML